MNHNCNSTKIMEHFYFFKNITSYITSYKTNMCRMLNSKEIAFIIIMAVLGFVLAIGLSQVTKMITGIPGSNYLCCIFLAIYTSFSLLLHEGKRGRFFLQYALFTVLIIPTFLGGPPFDVLARLNFFLTAFIIDLVFNNLYKTFKNTNKTKWWTTSGTLLFWVMLPFFSIIIKPLFFPNQYISVFISTISALMPLIIIQALAGGFIGYNIYHRTKKVF